MSETTQNIQSTEEFFTVEKQITLPHTAPNNGSFAIITSDTTNNIVYSNFVYCREQFHGSNTTPLSDLLFVHLEGKGRNIASFLRMVEERMGHELLTESGPTNVPTISWFKPANFWRRQPMRRCLFTILLRLGRAFNLRHNNFEEALYSDAYATGTRHAIEHFLKGNTWYTGENTGQGWVRNFTSLSPVQISKILTKKPVTDAMLFKFAMNKLGVDKVQLENEFRRTETPKKFSMKPRKAETEINTAPASAITDVTPESVSTPVPATAIETSTVSVPAPLPTEVTSAKRRNPLSASLATRRKRTVVRT